jgi:hypothetical protein
MSRQRLGRKPGPNGHQKHKYSESFVVSTSSIRAIKRNQVRRMAKIESMPLRQAWRLLMGREDLLSPVADMKSPKTAARRKTRQKLQKEARRHNR